MTTTSKDLGSTQHEFRRRRIASGEARCAIFRRTYDAPIDDVWDACTNPDRLGRWYAPVEGDLRVGGAFTQGDFGSGVITRCEAPRLLTVALGGDPAPDELELRLRQEADGITVLEVEHATTLDSHEIGGQMYDAVYCMGGGYGPRLVTLELHLRSELSATVDPTMLHTLPEFRSAIEVSMGALDVLVQADKAR